MPSRRWIKTLLSLLPAVFCYSCIFYLSHQSRLPGPGEEGLARFFWFKTGHVAAYTLLLASLLYAVNIFGSVWKILILKRKTFWISLSILIVLALLDEWHQSFIPGRTSRLSDVFIDVLGSGAVLFLVGRYNAFLPVSQGSAKKHGM